MSKTKPKTNRAGDIYEPKGYDCCQTPAYALEPLMPYIMKDAVIWESASGNGNLTQALLIQYGQVVVSTDIQTGQNFFEYEPEQYDVQITNPPYSIKYLWLKRSYELGKPFALLVPVEMLGAKTAQKLFKEHGFEIMLLDSRVDFEMPEKGLDGKGAQFPVMWLCWNILPGKVMFGSIAQAKKEFKDSLKPQCDVLPISV